MSNNLSHEKTASESASDEPDTIKPVEENFDPEPVYRSQKKRYPWWVKSVERPTIAVDRGKAERMQLQKTTFSPPARFFKPHNIEEMAAKAADFGISRYIGVDKTVQMHRDKWAWIEKSLKEDVPGFSHADWALYNAAYSVQYNFSIPFEELTEKSAYVNVQERYGLDPWKASELEASRKVEQAAIALGANQVGFAMIDPLYLYDGVAYPPEMKYVIVLLTRWSPQGDKRRDTALGAMDNRMCSSREWMLIPALRNFITGLGYNVNMLLGPQLAYAVQAGMGELGRMNRMVSPIVGAGTRVTALATDLPLAIDKPIDFGLQEFCRHCKKCAKACPAGAVSMAKEPTWEPKGEWNVSGKRVYYENSSLCYPYLTSRSTVCTLCMAACPWTKQSESSLHAVAKSIGATLPSLSGALVYLDDLFGYGPTKDPEALENWWDLNINEYGLGSNPNRKQG
jgi:reductive dehalogenase